MSASLSWSRWRATGRSRIRARPVPTPPARHLGEGDRALPAAHDVGEWNDARAQSAERRTPYRRDGET